MKPVLRAVTLDDLPHFFAHQREPAALHMAAFPSRDHEAFMAHWTTNILGNPRSLACTIVDDDGIVVGNIGAYDGDSRRMLGYWIGSAYWGRGLASRAVAELVRDREHTRPLFAYVAAHNIGSQRVLEKNGFTIVGAPALGADGVEELLYRLD